MLCRLCLVWLSMVLLTVSGPVSGQDLDVGALNNAAVELSKDGKLIEANRIWLDLISKVDEAHEYLWAFHMNVGRNFQKLEMYPEAWWHLSRCVELTTGKDERPVKWLSQVEDGLRGEYQRVVLVLAGPAAKLRPGRDELVHWYKAPLTWWFKPGEYQIGLRSERTAEAVRSVTIGPETKELLLALESLGPVAGDGQPLEPIPTWKWAVSGALGGVGVVLGVIGGVLYGKAADRLDAEKQGFQEWLNDEYQLGGKVPTTHVQDAYDEWDRRMEKVTSYETAAWVLWGVGGAAVIGGAVVLLTEAGRGKKGGGEAMFNVTPLYLPAGAGIGLDFTF